MNERIRIARDNVIAAKALVLDVVNDMDLDDNWVVSQLEDTKHSFDDLIDSLETYGNQL